VLLAIPARQGVAAIGIHRRAEQQVRVPRRVSATNSFARKLPSVRVEVPLGVHHPIERGADSPADILLGRAIPKCGRPPGCRPTARAPSPYAEAVQINFKPPVVLQAGRTKQPLPPAPIPAM